MEVQPIVYNIVNHCGYGPVDKVVEALGSTSTNINYEKDLELLLTEGFKKAASSGNLNIVKYCLTSPALPKHADIHFDDDYALRLASCYGHLKLVKYLLTSPELKEHANINHKDNEAFIWACSSNHLDVVQYLLESPDLKTHSNPNIYSNVTKSNAFMCCCDQNAMEVLEYLASLPDLDMNTSLYMIDGDGKSSFELACENHENNPDIVEFLILKCNYQLSPRIETYIEENLDNPIVVDAKKLLATRDLFNKFNFEIPNKINDNNFEKKKKI